MYIISPISVFDNDHQLWETYIGMDSKEKPLCFSCWGKTELESRINADNLVYVLNNFILL